MIRSLFALTLLLIGATAMSQAFEVRYRAVDKSLTSDSIHGEIVVKNLNAFDIPLNELQINYHYTPEGSSGLTGDVRWAMIIGPGFSPIKDKALLRFTPNTVLLTFDASAGSLKQNELVVVQFRATNVDGSRHQQANDPSFNASANFLTPTDSISVNIVPQIRLFGEVNDEDGMPISGAQVFANGISTVTETNGQFNISVTEADNVSVIIHKNGYADYYGQFKKQELVIAEPASLRARRSRIFIVKRSTVKNIEPALGGALVTPRGSSAIITFPQSGNFVTTPEITGGPRAFDVGLTSLYSANDEALLEPTNYRGQGLRAGGSDVMLDFSYVIDVVIHNTQGERIKLSHYDPAISVKIKTNCNSSSEVDTWYFDENDAVWVQNNSKARLIPADRNGTCYYEFFVTHFTKYAIARAFETDFTTLDFDFSALLAEPSVSNTEYLLEIESDLGTFHRANLLRSQLANYSVEVPTFRDVFVRLSNASSGKVSGIKLTRMADFTNANRLVILPAMTTPQWRSTWANRDGPSGNGDYESYENSAYYCSVPFAIKVREVGTTTEFSSREGIPNDITTFDRNTGFICINASQTNGQSCRNYEIKLFCQQ